MTDSLIPPGYCQCGCGARTQIIAQTNNKRGQVKGEYYKYITGHNPKSKPKRGNRPKKTVWKECNNRNCKKNFPASYEWEQYCSDECRKEEAAIRRLEKKGIVSPADVNRQLSEKAKQKLDREQAALNRNIDNRLWTRSGIVRDPGRVLPREEVDALVAAGRITHISKIPQDRFFSLPFE